MTPGLRIAADVREVAAMVDAARALVAAGELVDLDGLDTRVGAIMDRLKTIPAAQRTAVKPALIALMDSVAAIERAVVTQRDLVARELGNLAARRRAVTAYGTPVGGAKNR